ncbi:LOW QUALITY PROTEIN: hypothetical protein HID58_059554 [Brassica napus]|uniref:DC1 domain-containing protein n=1 Tax=Brassica napus TaxID=3708 RepID=A0ABQ7ZTD6_BRANA|nr:LOW QUALITY PROTEIN: hypothetical protein HID58_059554 [Brassica napus]
MDSIQLPPPIILVCPSLRYKCSSRTNYDRHAKFKIVDSPHYYPFAKALYLIATLATFLTLFTVCNSERLWDEKELEEEPEEEYENLNSFEVISAGIIQHFSHSHHMKFEKTTTDIMYDERCHACVLPFYGDMCSKAVESISIDVRCAAISEPFDHQCHPHPLFLSNEHGRYRPCSMCGKETLQTLNCIECDFFLRCQDKLLLKMTAAAAAGGGDDDDDDNDDDDEKINRPLCYRHWSASIRQNHNAWRLQRWFLLKACGVDGFPMILASWMHMNFTKSEGDFELLNPHKRPIYAGSVEPRRSLTKKEPVPKIVPVAAL